MRNIISIALLAGFLAAVTLPVLAHHECRSGEVWDEATKTCKKRR